MYAFHYQLTEDDYFEYSLCHQYSIPKYRKKLMTQKFLYPALYAAIAIILGSRLENPLFTYVAFGIVAVGWIVFYKSLIERNIHKSIKIMKESGKMPYADFFNAVFEDEKMITSTNDTEVTTNYSGIEKIMIGENALYLYKNAISAFILPYRIFASEEEKDTFIQFIKQKTNAAVISGVTK